MPKVTSLQAQKNNPGRYSVFIDGKYALGMSANELLASGLAVGDELSQQRIDELSQQSGLGKLYDKTVNFISFRPRSIREATDYLLRQGADQQTAEELVERLRTGGWIDDERFVEAWLSDRQKLKPTSRRQLELELRKKGIDKQIIAAKLEVIDSDYERAALRQLIDKKRRLSSYQDNNKLTRYLVSRGFDYDLIKGELRN